MSAHAPEMPTWLVSSSRAARAPQCPSGSQRRPSRWVRTAPARPPGSSCPGCRGVVPAGVSWCAMSWHVVMPAGMSCCAMSWRVMACHVAPWPGGGSGMHAGALAPALSCQVLGSCLPGAGQLPASSPVAQVGVVQGSRAQQPAQGCPPRLVHSAGSRGIECLAGQRQQGQRMPGRPGSGMPLPCPGQKRAQHGAGEGGRGLLTSHALGRSGWCPFLSG